MILKLGALPSGHGLEERIMTKFDENWVAKEEAKRAYMAEHSLYQPEDG